MGDGSYIAFFDLGENQMPEPSPNTPGWVQHLALEVESIGKVLELRDRLNQAGVETTDVVDHEFIKSVYFFDPNGLRLEITTRTEEPGYLEDATSSAHAALDAWSVKKAGRLERQEGCQSSRRGVTSSESLEAAAA